MTGFRRVLPAIVLAVVIPHTGAAQDAPLAPRPAVVVQVAGSTLYIGLGSDAGIRTGDTLAVRRAPTAAPVGSAAVIAATPTRSVLSFVGAPFPVTRGDTLFITPGAAPAPERIVTSLAATPRDVPGLLGTDAAPPRLSTTGAFGVELWGSHTETIGLGADPQRTSRDLAMPAVRYRSRTAGEHSEFNVSMRAQYRSGPPTIFDNAMRVRVYEARYDRRIGTSRLSVGRFFSDFDHASGFWDGASLRFGDNAGFFGGVAAGFEPTRGAEGFSADIPKAALFAGAQGSGEHSDYYTTVAYHQTFAKEYSLQRQMVDWTLRLRTGRLSLAQEVEASPPTRLGTWGISRYLLRASVPVSQWTEFYAAAVSDRPLPVDTGWVQPLERRERVSGGFSVQSPGGFYGDVNVTINGPRDSTSGHAAGLTLSFPRLIGSGGLVLSGSWFDYGSTTGITATPSMEYRFGSTRIRAGYQLYHVSSDLYSVTSNGLDLRLSQAFLSRFNWVLQLSGRTGQNLRSGTVYSSFEVRF